jgi:hypothetical protein
LIWQHSASMDRMACLVGLRCQDISNSPTPAKAGKNY